MFLLIDKPKGITSHDVVDRVRKITGEKRVGHAGTLDPNATGLLIVGVGRNSTKMLWEKFGKLNKTYIAEITLGEERETDDKEGVKRQENKKTLRNPHYSKSQISDTLKTFLGKQLQVPPVYSAIKVKGKKAYELARKSKESSSDVILDPRKIEIFDIKLLEYEYPIVKIETQVSSGTYVRALARDIGRKLGCGAFLSELARTEIGMYSLKNAVKLSLLQSGSLEKYSVNL